MTDGFFCRRARSSIGIKVFVRTFHEHHRFSGFSLRTMASNHLYILLTLCIVSIGVSEFSRDGNNYGRTDIHISDGTVTYRNTRLIIRPKLNDTIYWCETSLKDFDLYVIEANSTTSLWAVPRSIISKARCLQKLYSLDYFYYPDGKYPYRIADVRIANNVLELPKWTNLSM